MLPPLSVQASRSSERLATFDRVPLFYYVLHLFVIHGLAVVVAVITYSPAVQSAFQGGMPKDYGYNLAVVYMVWAGVILALYPVCRWFANLKRRRKEAWLSYI